MFILFLHPGVPPAGSRATPRASCRVAAIRLWPLTPSAHAGLCASLANGAAEARGVRSRVQRACRRQAAVRVRRTRRDRAVAVDGHTLIARQHPARRPGSARRRTSFCGIGSDRPHGHRCPPGVKVRGRCQPNRRWLISLASRGDGIPPLTAVVLYAADDAYRSLILQGCGFLLRPQTVIGSFGFFRTRSHVISIEQQTSRTTILWQ